MNTTIAIPPLTPAQLAGLFWEMDAQAQGLFFDELGQQAITTPAPFTREIGSMSPLDWQMFVASAHATPLGRDAMARICENGVKILKPCGVTDIDIITQLGDRCMELNNERAELRAIKAAYEAEKAAHLSARECLKQAQAELAGTNAGVAGITAEIKRQRERADKAEFACDIFHKSCEGLAECLTSLGVEEDMFNDPPSLHEWCQKKEQRIKDDSRLLDAGKIELMNYENGEWAPCLFEQVNLREAIQKALTRDAGQQTGKPQCFKSPADHACPASMPKPCPHFAECYDHAHGIGE
jgi:hypothetical protein